MSIQIQGVEFSLWLSSSTHTSCPLERLPGLTPHTTKKLILYNTPFEKSFVLTWRIVGTTTASRKKRIWVKFSFTFNGLRHPGVSFVKFAAVWKVKVARKLANFLSAEVELEMNFENENFFLYFLTKVLATQWRNISSLITKSTERGSWWLKTWKTVSQKRGKKGEKSAHTLPTPSPVQLVFARGSTQRSGSNQVVFLWSYPLAESTFFFE